MINKWIVVGGIMVLQGWPIFKFAENVLVIKACLCYTRDI